MLHEVKDAFLWDILVGKKGWKVYDLEFGELFVIRDVIFYETIFPHIAENKSCKNHIERSEFFEIKNSTLQEPSARLVGFGEEPSRSKQAQNRTRCQEVPSTEKQDQQLLNPTWVMLSLARTKAGFQLAHQMTLHPLIKPGPTMMDCLPTATTYQSGGVLNRNLALKPWGVVGENKGY